MRACRSPPRPRAGLSRCERIGSWIFVVTAVLASGAVFTLALKLLPIYRDLDRRVPLLAEHPSLVWIFAAGCACAAWAWSRSPPTARRITASLSLVLLVGLAGFVAAHFFMPFIGTIENIGPISDPPAPGR